MSTVGPSGQGHEPAADPWTDLTDPAPPASPAPQHHAPSLPTPPVYQQGHAQPPAQPGYDQPFQPAQYQPSQYQPNSYAQNWTQPGYAEPQQGYSDPQSGYAEGQQGYADAEWGAPPKQRNTAVVILSIMLAVVVLAGVGVGAYLFLNRSSSSTAAAIPRAGQCVRSNSEPEPHTKMSVVTCEPGALKVLKTVTGTDQITECDGVTALTNVYHFTPSSGTLSETYVLCLGAST
jgi:uncharacterized protein (UPF0333 family)